LVSVAEHEGGVGLALLKLFNTQGTAITFQACFEIVADLDIPSGLFHDTH
jgi:hypothetical protein